MGPESSLVELQYSVVCWRELGLTRDLTQGHRQTPGFKVRAFWGDWGFGASRPVAVLTEAAGAVRCGETGQAGAVVKGLERQGIKNWPSEHRGVWRINVGWQEKAWRVRQRQVEVKSFCSCSSYTRKRINKTQTCLYLHISNSTRGLVHFQSLNVLSLWVWAQVQVQLSQSLLFWACLTEFSCCALSFIRAPVSLNWTGVSIYSVVPKENR